MISRKMIGLRLGFALLMGGTALGAAAGAQGANSSAYGQTAGDALTRNLRLIADQPRNVSALIGAGRAALELGDPQAALTFFARAEEIAPTDGRVKAGMGAVFVQMGQAPEALKFFRDAASLGVPEAEFAGDRGLAYDLSGDPRRAQADYNLALRSQENAEVRRRLALSLAISGDRARALTTIDTQLRGQDRAAWRVRSFILALTGDAAEATRYAEAVMPYQAAQLRPFFTALPGLKPADRASAVHFGHFPEAPGALQTAIAQAQYASAAPVQTAPQALPQQTASSRRSKTPEPVSNAPRRRPGSEDTKPSTPRDNQTALWAERYGWTGRGVTPKPNKEAARPTILADSRPAGRAPAATASQPAMQTPAVAQPEQPKPAAQQPQSTTLPQQPPVATAPAQPAPPVRAPTETASNVPSASTPIVTTIPHFSLRTSPAVSPSTSSIRAAEVAPSQVGTQPGSLAPTPPAAASPVPQTPRASGLAGIVATIESLPAEAPPAPARAESKPSLPTQLAANSASRPSYGPKFETSKAQTATPTAEEKKEESSKKEPAPRTAAASSKRGDPKLAAAKKGDESKLALSKTDEDGKSASAKKDSKSKVADAKKEEPKAKEPSRNWVQIAGGANEDAMSREFTRLKAKAPKLLASRTPWTTPLKATNRLLVGPFKSADEAQEFVNELSKQGVSAFSWTSPAGQEILKLASK